MWKNRRRRSSELPLAWQSEYFHDLLVTTYRILTELSPSEEPIWAYFDAQHKHILSQMREVYDTSAAAVKGIYVSPTLVVSISPFPAIHDKTTTQSSSPDALTQTLAMQLKVCIYALETKQSDIVIGRCISLMQAAILMSV